MRYQKKCPEVHHLLTFDTNRVRAIAAVAVALISLSWGACGIKRTVTVPVASRVLAAKTATLEDLLARLRSHSDKLSALSSTTLRVSFTSGKVESGKLQEYRSAPGYLLLKRPDALRLNIQNPLTKTAIVELASSGDEFSVWYPRDNKYFVGRNSTKEFDADGAQNSPAFTARPIHIFEAIVPQRLELEDPQNRIAMEEDRDSTAKYYVLSLYKLAGRNQLRPVRRIWIERSQLEIVKQQTFAEDGAVASIIHYSNLAPVEGLLLPLSIRIERPADGYLLDMQFKSWRVNPEIPTQSFVLSPPPGAQRVLLKEKPRSKGR